MKINEETKLNFEVFSRIPVGSVITRSGVNYLKINKEEVFLLGGTMTTKIDLDEYVIVRDAEITIK